MRKKYGFKIKLISNMQNWLISDRTSKWMRKILIYAIAIILALTFYPLNFPKLSKLVPTAQASNMTVYQVGGTYTQGELFNPRFYILGAGARGDYIFYWGGTNAAYSQVVWDGAQYIFQNTKIIDLTFGGKALEVQGGKIIFGGNKLALWSSRAILIYNISANTFQLEKELLNEFPVQGIRSTTNDRIIVWSSGNINMYASPPAYNLENTKDSPGFIRKLEIGVNNQIFILDSENDDQQFRLRRYNGDQPGPNPEDFPLVFEKIWPDFGVIMDDMSLVAGNYLVVFTSRKPFAMGNWAFTIHDIVNNTWNDYLFRPPAFDEGFLMYNNDDFIGVGDDYMIRFGDDPWYPGWGIIGADYKALSYNKGIGNLEVGGSSHVDFSPSERVPRISEATALGSNDFAVWNYGRKIQFSHIDRGLPVPNQMSVAKDITDVPFDIQFGVPAKVAGDWTLVVFEGYIQPPNFAKPEIKKTDYYVAGVPDYSLSRNQNEIFLNTDKDVTYTINYKNVSARGPLDVVMILDITGSMLAPTGIPGLPKKIDVAKDATKRFIDLLNPVTDRVAQVVYASENRGLGWNGMGAWMQAHEKDPKYQVRYARALGLTNNFAAAKAWLDPFSAAGSTPIGAGILAGNKILEWNGNPAAKRVMVLATDGQDNTPPSHDSKLGDVWNCCDAGPPFNCDLGKFDDWGQPNVCWDPGPPFTPMPYAHNDEVLLQTTRDLGFQIYTVGIAGDNSNYDITVLRDHIAIPTGGAFVEGRPEELADVYRRIARMILGGIEDTIPDGTNLKSVDIGGNTFKWNPATNKFNPDPTKPPYNLELSFNPATRIIKWLNAQGNGDFQITINVPKTWVATHGPANSYKLHNIVTVGDASSYDDTYVLSGDIKGLGDVFMPGVSGGGAYVSLTPGAISTFTGEWVFSDYQFRRKTMMDWKLVQDNAKEDWPELENQALQLQPLVSGMILNLHDLDNKNGIWKTAGDLPIPPNVKITGKGTILVNGDLDIQGNISYVRASSDSVGFIVKGSVNVAGNTTSVVGNYLVLTREPDLETGKFKVKEPDPNTNVFRLRGLVVANEFDFNRTRAVNHPSVIFIYDGSAITMTPPGFKQIFAPTWGEIFP